MAKKVEFNMAAVKKYLFWACVPLGLVVAVILGMMATGEVGSKLEDRKKQLDSQKTTIEGLRAGNHPNQGTADEIDEKREELVKKILTAWETLEKDQKEQNRWEGLADRALEDIRRKNFLDPLEPATLTNWLNFARDEMKKLIDRADIDRCRPYVRYRDGREEPLETNEPAFTGEGGSGTGRRGSGVSMDTPGSRSPGSTATPGAVGAGGVQIMKGKVVWSNLQMDITVSDWNRQPQSFEVWLTQEDLWVYQALLWVVAQTNKDSKVAEKFTSSSTPGATAASTAGGGRPLDLSGSVIKEIVALAIGRKAAMELEKQSSRRIGGGGSRSEISGRSGVTGREGTGGPEATRSTAMAGRYVDDAGNPLMDADLTGQLRRMPIYLRFVVDQRRISDVLVNCANCPMPIDVLWVRVNPDATDSFDFVTSGTGESSSPRSSRSSGGVSPTSRSSSSASGGVGGASPGRGSGSGTNEIDFGPDAITIEIYGCINIFTPPDATKITAEGGGIGNTP